MWKMRKALCSLLVLLMLLGMAPSVFADAGGQWVGFGNQWAYQYTDGSWAYGWLKDGSDWYYFDAAGWMVTGWKEIGGNWYYFYGSGAMAANTTIDGCTLNSDGAWVTDRWVDFGGLWAYQFSNGSWAYGWQQIDGAWYYFDNGGWMATGWQEIGGNWYYFYGSGVMAANTTIDGYTLNESGVLVNNTADFDPDIVFTTTDLNGNQYTDSVFANADVTMLNLWAYWCGPCVGELQSLQMLQNNYANRGFQIFGVSYNNFAQGDKEEFARQGITYPSLIATSELSRALSTGSVPTTIFVDRNGHILCDPLIGSRSYGEWASIIEGYLG